MPLNALKQFLNKQSGCCGHKQSREAGPGPQDDPAVLCGGSCLQFDEEGIR